MKKWFVGALLAISGLVAVILTVLFATTEGLRLGVRVADRFLPGQLSVQSVQGLLVSSFVLEGLAYTEKSTTLSIELIKFSWDPVSLLRKEVDIDSLLMNNVFLQIPAGDSNDFDSEDASFPSFALPLSISMKSGFIDTLVVQSEGDAPAVHLNSFGLENFRGEESLFRFAKLEITAEQFRIASRGQLQTGEVYSTSLNVDYSFNSDDGFPPLTGKGVMQGSLAELEFEASTLGPFAGKVKGILFDIGGDLRWEGSLHSDTVLFSDLHRDWPELVLTDLQISGGGTLSSYSLEAATAATFNQFQHVHVTADIEGDIGGMEITSARVEHGGSALFATGRLMWREELAWQAEVTGSNIDPGAYYPGWPGSLDLEASTSGRNAGGAVTGGFDLIKLDGELKGYPLLAKGKISTDGEKLAVEFFTIQSSDSRLTVNGQFGWGDRLTWQAEFSGAEINPAVYDSRWPGSLRLEASTSGSQADGKMEAVVDLIRLEGDLRGYPVQAEARVKVDDHDIAIDTFTVNSSDSLLRASGSLSDNVNLLFTVDSPDLNAFWPDLSGRVEGSARFTGLRQQPEFHFDLSGDDVVYGDTGIEDLYVTGTGQAVAEGAINASIAAEEITMGGSLLDSVAVDISGTLQDHSLAAAIDADDASAIFSLDGGYTEKTWRGQIGSATLQADRFGNWQLQDPVRLTLSADSAELAPLCLAGPQSALACMEGTYQKTGEWSAGAELIDIPLDMLEDMQSRISGLGGVVSASADVEGRGKEIVKASLNLSSEELSALIDITDDKRREIVWRSNTFHAFLEGSSANVSINSILEDGSSVTMETNLTEIGLSPYSLEKAGVRGRLDFDIKELEPLSTATFPDVDASGILRGEMELSGRLVQPDLLGFAKLEEGEIIIPALGIAVNNVEMNLDGKGNSLRLDLHATSGGGKIHANGAYTFTLNERNPVEFTITGEQFEIVNLPDVKIKVSPDLRMKFDEEQESLQGNILLTEAYISSQKLSGTVSPSRDVVFVEKQQGPKEMPLPFHADITVVAGDNVRVNAFGLRGKIQGRLAILAQPSKTATGEGKLEVREGTFSIYGRQLQIVRGRLLYNGNPLDNPGIEVRAENTAGGVTTGIQVSGFLREPDVSFYSIPAMAQDEIIKRLLMNTSLVGGSEDKGFLGSVASDTGMDPIAAAVQDVKESLRVDDIKIETGKASDDLSLVIGTWLTPKLYISYGKNLLKESGNFYTRYILGHGFSLETESGTTQSGVDLMYEIER